MENTLENKIKFYSQYLFTDSNFKYQNTTWGNEIVYKESILDLGTLSLIKSHTEIHEYYANKLRNGFLELKSISSITNEELGSIARFYKNSATNVYIDDDQLTFDFMYGDETESIAVQLNSGYCLDFLRRNGFAMEWLGLSVEKQIENGWIKLKSE